MLSLWVILHHDSFKLVTKDQFGDQSWSLFRYQSILVTKVGHRCYIGSIPSTKSHNAPVTRESSTRVPGSDALFPWYSAVKVRKVIFLQKGIHCAHCFRGSDVQALILTFHYAMRTRKVAFLQKEINCAFWCSLRVKNLEAE